MLLDTPVSDIAPPASRGEGWQVWARVALGEQHLQRLGVQRMLLATKLQSIHDVGVQRDFLSLVGVAGIFQ